MMAFSHLSGRSQQTQSERKMQAWLPMKSIQTSFWALFWVTQKEQPVWLRSQEKSLARSLMPEVTGTPFAPQIPEDPVPLKTLNPVIDIHSLITGIYKIWMFPCAWHDRASISWTCRKWRNPGQQKRKFTSLLMLFSHRAFGRSNVQWPAHPTTSGMAQPIPGVKWGGPRGRSWPRRTQESGNARSQAEQMLWFRWFTAE